MGPSGLFGSLLIPSDGPSLVIISDPRWQVAPIESPNLETADLPILLLSLPTFAELLHNEFTQGFALYFQGFKNLQSSVNQF
jgi:hypothetical protein